MLNSSLADAMVPRGLLGMTLLFPLQAPHQLKTSAKQRLSTPEINRQEAPLVLRYVLRCL